MYQVCTKKDFVGIPDIQTIVWEEEIKRYKRKSAARVYGILWNEIEVGGEYSVS